MELSMKSYIKYLIYQIDNVFQHYIFECWTRHYLIRIYLILFELKNRRQKTSKQKNINQPIKQTKSFQTKNMQRTAALFKRDIQETTTQIKSTQQRTQCFDKSRKEQNHSLIRAFTGQIKQFSVQTSRGKYIFHICSLSRWMPETHCRISTSESLIEYL